MPEAVVNPSAYYKKRGFVSVRERDGFRRIKDIAETFGVPVASIRRGFQYKGGALWPGHDGMLLWWPKPVDWCTSKNVWMNEFGEADVEIAEWHEDHNASANHVEQVIAEGCARPTFKVEEHSKHGYCYRFIGVYRLDINRSRRAGKAIWVREPDVDRIEV